MTGNTGVDALHAALATLPPVERVPTGPDDPLRLLVTCHRRENWGTGVTALAVALVELAAQGNARVDVVLHPNPRAADAMRLLFAGKAGIDLIPPADHRAMIQRMRHADLILSDSGGVQEEAPTIGVPLLVLRDKTERPEALASGNAVLVGTSSERIVAEVRRLHRDRAALARMARPAAPFGDGRAAPRIAGLIRQWLREADRPALARNRA